MEGTHDFPNIKSSQCSPMARRLMTIEGISRVFYGTNFISVSKEEETDWQNIKP